MAVAAEVGVQVGGRVSGTEVCAGWELSVELPQADIKMSSKEVMNIDFLLME